MPLGLAGAALANFLDMDYGALGVILVIAGYWPRVKGGRILLMGLVLAGLYLGYASDWFVDLSLDHFIRLLGALMGLGMAALCRPERPCPRAKWLFYAAYPVHLAVLLAVRAMMGG